MPEPGRINQPCADVEGRPEEPALDHYSWGQLLGELRRLPDVLEQKLEAEREANMMQRRSLEEEIVTLRSSVRSSSRSEDDCLGSLPSEVGSGTALAAADDTLPRRLERPAPVAVRFASSDPLGHLSASFHYASEVLAHSSANSSVYLEEDFEDQSDWNPAEEETRAPIEHGSQTPSSAVSKLDSSPWGTTSSAMLQTSTVTRVSSGPALRTPPPSPPRENCVHHSSSKSGTGGLFVHTDHSVTTRPSVVNSISSTISRRMSAVKKTLWVVASMGTIGRRHVQPYWHRTFQQSLKSNNFLDPDLHVDEIGLVYSTGYQIIIGLLILGNALWIGWQVEHEAVHGELPTYSDFVGIAFLVIFLLDLFLRLRQDGLAPFFLGAERNWNWFDFIIVMTMLADKVASGMVDGSLVAKLWPLRALRLLRILRIIRVVRVLSLFGEFRFLLYSMMAASAWRSLCWVAVLLVLTMYVTGVSMVEGSLEQCNEMGSLPVCAHFGTLTKAMLMLYKASFGGILWGECLHELEMLGGMYPIVMVIYIGFVMMMLLNITTAVFLRVATDAAERQKDHVIQEEIARNAEYISRIRDAFSLMDIDGSGGIGADEFELALEDPKVASILTRLKLDTSDCKGLFDLFDKDSTGEIDIGEFLDGCMRLKGEGKSFDIMKLQLQTETLMHHLGEVRRAMGINTAMGRKTTVFMGSSSLGVNWKFFPPSRQVSSHAAQDGGAVVADGSGGSSLPMEVAGSNDNLRTVGCIASSPASVDSRSLDLSRLASGNNAFERKGKVIKRTEMRAMLLRELQGLVPLIKDTCVKEGWADMRTGQKLRPEEVNLYHFTYHHICVATAPRDGIIVRLQAPITDTELSLGTFVTQVDPTQPRALPMAEGVLLDANPAAGELKLEVLRGTFVPEGVGLNQPIMCEGVELGVAQDIITPGALSYKEYISGKPTRPLWYCSHWWGQQVLAFVAFCEEHARVRQLSRDQASYWVCGYANRQYDLGNDIDTDPEDSSFRKAMSLAEGVLLILDQGATPFQRIWCDFELYKALSDKNQLLDIVALGSAASSKGSPKGDRMMDTRSRDAKTDREGTPIVLSDGLLPGETLSKKSRRESKFPLSLLVRGMVARLEEGDCTVPVDKDRILECIGRDAKGDREAAVDIANKSLHALLAVAAWPQALQRNLVMDLDVAKPGTLNLPEVLISDEHMGTLNLSLANFVEVTDSDVATLAEGLPPNLRNLSLNFAGCVKITSAGVISIAKRLPVLLRMLELTFTGCKKIDDEGIKALAVNMPPRLVELKLHFLNCHDVTSDGAATLASALPSTLMRLQATFRGTEIDKNFKCPAELRKMCGKRTSWLWRPILAKTQAKSSG